MNAHVAVRGQHARITLTRHDGADDLLPGLADDVADDVGQLQVHLRERLLHMLHVAGLRAQQHRALTRDRA